MTRHLLLTLLAAPLALPAQALPTGHPAVPGQGGVQPTWTPHRVYDTKAKQFIDTEAMAAELAKADVVLIGEQHDDPGTHAMQRALLEAIGRRRAHVVLAMEMFERDVQPLMDAYLAGRLPEDSLLAAGRPWPRYRTDYRPMVEWAHAQGWPVIAGNVPRPIASAISRGGMAAIDTLDTRSRGMVAATLSCEHDDYFSRFEETMKDHVPGDTPEAKSGAMERFYLAQCAKDETMGESIAQALVNAGVGALVVHVNGAFHSDFGLGTAARAARRLPGKSILVVSAIPVADLDGIAVEKDDLKLGRYLLYTLRP
jgi:uncharacterized iron-regulated protein